MNGCSRLAEEWNCRAAVDETNFGFQGLGELASLRDIASSQVRGFCDSDNHRSFFLVAHRKYSTLIDETHQAELGWGTEFCFWLESKAKTVNSEL
jgi:hypothetical protein